MIVVALALLLGSSVLAESAKERAAALLRRGNALCDRGDYDACFDHYRQARAVYPSFKIDFNFALALAKAGRSVEAARELELFLRQAARTATPDKINIARGKLAELRRGLVRLTVSCDVVGAVVTLDGAPMGRTPLAAPLYLRPGRYLVAVEHPDRQRYAKRHALSAGADLRLDIALPEVKNAAEARATVEMGFVTPVPRARPPAKDGRRPRVWTWVAAATAGASLVTAIVVGAGARADHEEYLTTSSAARAGELETSGRRKSLAANCMFGVGGALAVTAVVLFFLENRSPERPRPSRAVQVTPLIGRGAGAGFVLDRRF